MKIIKINSEKYYIRYKTKDYYLVSKTKDGAKFKIDRNEQTDSKKVKA